MNALEGFTQSMIQLTSFVLLALLCGEVVFRTAVMTWRALKSSWEGRKD